MDEARADLAHMRAALALARRGLGNTWPNPAVGCVIVDREGQVVGRGWTQPGGRPHAEREALDRAGELARGACAYVTLEPCNHHGKTPPCADALVAAGLGRVVVAMEDPDPRTAGGGIETLRRAGIRVDVGLCAAEAAELNAGFLGRIVEGRPLFTVKVASSLDGRIATGTADSRWITGAAARAEGHRLRAVHDAIMVGSGTALADDPELTCRLPGLEGRSPVRIVCDGRLRLPLAAKVVASARQVPTILCTARGHGYESLDGFYRAGVQVIELETLEDGTLDLEHLAYELGGIGLTRVLVEGGGQLIASLIRQGLADRLAWFRAPRLIGGDGIAAVGALGVDKLDATPYFVPSGHREVAPDVVETYRKRD